MGCLYFNKHKGAFESANPESCFKSVYSEDDPPTEHHKKWISCIREAVWTEIQNEEDLLPSWDSLNFHWLRTCWVSTMYQQVYDPHPHLLDPSEHGWQLKDGQLHIHWDTQENMENVRSRVHRLTKGCSCKSGCQQKGSEVRAWT